MIGCEHDDGSTRCSVSTSSGTGTVHAMIVSQPVLSIYLLTTHAI